MQTIPWNRISLMAIFFLSTLLPCRDVSAQEQGGLCGETPSDILLMLDRTGSVRDSERAKEAEAAKHLVDLLLDQSENRIALGAFGPGISGPQSEAEILSRLGKDPETLKHAVDTGMTKASPGGTNLFSALETAHNELDFGNNPNRVLILISDGNPNLPHYINIDLSGSSASDPSNLALNAAINLKNDGIRIFTIAFDASDDKASRVRLATMASHESVDDTDVLVDEEDQTRENQDGDDFFIAPTAADLDRVFKTIGEIILCDDQDPCTKDRCASDGHCHYDPNPACESPPSKCEGENCPDKIFQDFENDRIPAAQTVPDLQTQGSGANMVQGGGLACSLGPIPQVFDWGTLLLGLSGLVGGLFILRRPR